MLKSQGGKSAARTIGLPFVLFGGYLVAVGAMGMGLPVFVFHPAYPTMLPSPIGYLWIGSAGVLVAGLYAIVAGLALTRHRAWARSALRLFVWVSLLSIIILTGLVFSLLAARPTIFWVATDVFFGAAMVGILLWMLWRLNSPRLLEELQRRPH